MPAGQDRVRVTLGLAPWLPAEPRTLFLEGRATIGGREVVRTAVPADDMMQAFAYEHLVPAQALTLVVPRSRRIPKRPADPRSFRPSLRLLSDVPVRIPLDGNAQVQAYAPWDDSRGAIHIELSDPPDGIRIAQASCSNRTATMVLHCDARKVQQGLQGNLIAQAFQERTQTNKEGKTRQYRTFLGPLPAIPFEVVPQ